MAIDSLPTFVAPGLGELSDEMLAAYHETGVLILEDFVDTASCQRLVDRAGELIDAFDPGDVASVFSSTRNEQHDDRYFIESGDKIRFFLEADAFDDAGKLRQSKEDSLNKIGHAMHDLDPVFDAFSHSASLENLARGLGFRRPGIIQSMYIFKPPRIGGEVVCHQDSTYLYTEPESCVGFWFALEDATEDNGCMYFIPGAHTSPLRQRNSRIGAYRLRTDVIDDTPWPDIAPVAAPARAGTLVVFHGRAPHFSGPNRSDRSRHAYTMHVIDQACHYPEENWLQRGPDLPLRGLA
jgi:phytanoyl-CoA hydroxylase